jgi:beta-N-acetylhexosaminidase
VDSHLELPIVTASRNALIKQDFIPFQVLSDMPMAMTAHVVYTALDKDAPATTSKKVIRSIIRRHIGFEGLIMSDDLSMKALGGTFAQRTHASFAAGCDVVLHCNGVMSEMREIAQATPVLAGKAKQRAQAALARLVTRVEPFDVERARHRVSQALERANAAEDNHKARIIMDDLMGQSIGNIA